DHRRRHERRRLAPGRLVARPAWRHGLARGAPGDPGGEGRRGRSGDLRRSRVRAAASRRARGGRFRLAARPGCRRRRHRRSGGALRAPGGDPGGHLRRRPEPAGPLSRRNGRGCRRVSPPPRRPARL
ncbi:MAG: hypothetical protein AVDCRST_MAG17-842, partial [uncultured Solirubrobacterales bacterium]